MILQKNANRLFRVERLYLLVSGWHTQSKFFFPFPFLNSLLLYWVVYQAKQKKVEEEEKTFRHRRDLPDYMLGKWNESKEKSPDSLLLHAGVDLFTPSPSFFYAFLSLSRFEMLTGNYERRVYMSLLYHCYFVFPLGLSGTAHLWRDGQHERKKRRTPETGALSFIFQSVGHSKKSRKSSYLIKNVVSIIKKSRDHPSSVVVI